MSVAVFTVVDRDEPNLENKGRYCQCEWGQHSLKGYLGEAAECEGLSGWAVCVSRCVCVCVCVCVCEPSMEVH